MISEHPSTSVVIHVSIDHILAEKKMSSSKWRNLYIGAIHLDGQPVGPTMMNGSQVYRSYPVT